MSDVLDWLDRGVAHSEPARLLGDQVERIVVLRDDYCYCAVPATKAVDIAQGIDALQQITVETIGWA